MPKQRGTPGGRLIKVKDIVEYDRILHYLLDEFKPEDNPEWNRFQRRRFKAKSANFEVCNDELEGDWPHGVDVLYIRETSREDPHIITGLKLYVPAWQKKNIIGKFHTADGPTGHLGRNKLHHFVRPISAHIGRYCQQLKTKMLFLSCHNKPMVLQNKTVLNI